MNETLDSPRSARDRIGSVGVWLNLAGKGASESRQAAREVERLGYRALWSGESPSSGDIFARHAVLLAETEQLVLASGIANIWIRDAATTTHAAAVLGEAYPGRFLLGLGASHASIVDGADRSYTKPLSKMARYLDEMDAATYDPPAPEPPVERVLAALRPKMIELARERSAGVHPYLTPPEHSALAREILGPAHLVAPEQKVLLERDPVKARAIARATVRYYLHLPNYVNNLRALGFTDDDVAGDGSDRLIDSLVAWGDAEDIVKRVCAHLDAGADHVAVQPLTADGSLGLGQLAELAPALLGS